LSFRCGRDGDPGGGRGDGYDGVLPETLVILVEA
jgi:hypothetical protein